MKTATIEELDRLVPLESVDTDEGPRWQLKVRCRSCHVEIILRSELKPNDTARAIAAGAMPRVVGGIVCEECGDRLEAEAAKADQRAAFRARLAGSNLPGALHGFEFSEMVPEEGRKFVIERIRAWAAEEKPQERGICLYGEVGTGKTRLAATAAWQRLQRWDIKWVSMPILLAQLGAAFNDKARREAISVLGGKGALILDDLDKVNPSEWAVNQVFAALDTRIQAGAPLLITTNLRPDRLGDKFGDPVMSRVAGLEVYELPGRDNRIELPIGAEQA